MSGLLKGDFGLSIKKRGRTVSQIIGTKFPVSAKVGALALVLAVCTGIPLGAIAAFNRGKFIDNLLVVLSTAGIAIPSFLSSTILIYVFTTKLNWLPSLGLKDAKSYIMPVMALALYPSFYMARLMRSSMLDVMGQDYMRTAKAKGVTTFKAIFKHALRNATLMTGSFIIEKIFNIPGLGSEFVSSITSRDYPMIMGTTIFLAVFIIIMNLFVDIAYAIVDPRIKLK